MGQWTVNSEQWAWIVICAACVGTAALLLAWQQESPKPNPWLISPRTAPVPLIDLENSISVHVLGSEVASSEKVRQPFGVGLQEMLPIRVGCLFPELVIGVGLHYQQYGLNYIAKGGSEPMFDPETLWRIPESIGIEPMLPLVREILPEEIVILNARRAGNRGRANLFETTPIS
jgi:hypothetical protein